LHSRSVSMMKACPFPAGERGGEVSESGGFNEKRE